MNGWFTSFIHAIYVAGFVSSNNGFISGGTIDGITIPLSKRACSHEQDWDLGMDSYPCGMLTVTKLAAGRRGLTRDNFYSCCIIVDGKRNNS